MSSLRDYEQIIQDVHDEPTHTLKVSGTFTTTNASIGENGEPAPDSSSQGGGVDGSGDLQPFEITDDGELKVSDVEVRSILDSRLTGSLVPAEFDQINLTYVASGDGIGQIETATYLLSATPVRTLTLTYNGDDKLSSVVAT